MNILNKTAFDLSILQTANTLCAANWSWCSDNNHWIGFLIWHVISGGAKIIVNEEQYQLVPGDNFLFDLSQNHICSHNPQQPLHVQTVYFHLDSDIIAKQNFRKLFNNSLFGELISRSIQYFQMGNIPQAEIWLRPVVAEFFTEYEQTENCTDVLIRQMCHMVKANLQEWYSLDDFSKQGNYSKNHIMRLFKEKKGMSIHQYCMQTKINESKKMLLYSNKTISEIADFLGYVDISHFSKQFKKITGLSPKNFRISRM